MTLHFGFVLNGGFVAIDTATRASVYADPTSPNCTSAHHDEALAADRMIDLALGERDEVSPVIWRECYRLCAGALRLAGREIET